MTATRVRVVVTLGLLLAGTADPARAAAAVAHITYADQAATIHRASRPAPAYRGSLLYHADHVWTAAGRAEITFTDGSVLHVDRESHVIVYDGDRFAVIDGRVVFRSTAAALGGYAIQTASGMVRALPLGVFSILADERGGQVLVSVEIGEALVENRFGRTRMTSRQATLISAAMGRPYVMQSARPIDMFDRWSSARVQADVASIATRRAEPEPMHFLEDERAYVPELGYYSPQIVIVNPPNRFYPNGQFRRPGFSEGVRDGHQETRDGGRRHRPPARPPVSAPAPPPAAAPAPPPAPPAPAPASQPNARPFAAPTDRPVAGAPRWVRSPQ